MNNYERGLEILRSLNLRTISIDKERNAKIELNNMPEITEIEELDALGWEDIDGSGLLWIYNNC